MESGRVHNTTDFDRCPKCGELCTWQSYAAPGLERTYYVPFCKWCEEKDFAKDLKHKTKKIEQYKETVEMQANLPTRYDCYWWDTFPDKSQEQTNMIKHLKWYTENWRAKKLKHNFLTLWGGVGTGKTCMAVIIAKCLISYYAVKTRFISGQQLVDEMMQGIRDFKLSAKEVQGYYYHLPLLIVDDFWAENSSPAVKNRLFDLLNFRYHRQSCTILTTNVVLSESNDAQLIRLWDRIKEQPNKQIKFSWNSLRSSG